MSFPDGGFNPPAGSGSIQQGFHGRGMVRMRRIQRPRSDLPGYTGTYVVLNQPWRPAEWNRKRQAYMARYWRTRLNNAQRVGWDLIAPGLFSGRDLFISANKVGGPCVGDDANPPSIMHQIRFSIAPASFTAPVSPSFSALTLLSRNSEGGPLAAFIDVSPYVGLNWRVYATLPLVGRSTARNSPLIALASGPFVEGAPRGFHQLGTLIYQWVPTLEPTPQDMIIDALFDDGLPGGFPADLSITLDPDYGDSRFQLVAGPGFTQIADIQITAFGITYPFAASFVLRPHSDIPFPLPPADGVLVGGSSSSGSLGFSGMIIHTRTDGPFSIPNFSPQPANIDLFTFDRFRRALHINAEFTAQYLRIMGSLHVGARSQFALRLVNPLTGSGSLYSIGTGVVA